MSLRYPSKTVKLPFNASNLSSSGSNDEGGFLPTKRTYTTSQIEQTICGMSVSASGFRCGKNQSKYVCPRCNIFYCSLDCFRDEKHLQCSEPFYATAIREAIQTDSASSSDEKRKMMEMLARFERGETEGGDGGDVNGLEELLKGMGGIDGEQQPVDEEAEADEGFDALEMLKLRLSDSSDLENMDLQDLLELLPPSHREQFLSLISDPDSDQVQRLLGNLDDSERKALEGGSVPWFMLENSNDGLEHEGEGNDDQPLDRGMVKPPPASSDIVQGIHVDPSVGVKLLYNTLAICLAYVHVLMSQSLPSLAHAFDPRRRSTSTASEASNQTTVQNMLSLIPFLSDPKSTVRFASVREAWEGVWDHVEAAEAGAAAKHQGHDTMDGPLVTCLAQLQTLIVPSLDLSKGQEQGLELALSDLHAFFSTCITRTTDPSKMPNSGADPTNQPMEDKQRRRQQKLMSLATKKLAFYLAAVRSVREQYGRKVWLELSQEVGKEVQALRAEYQDRGDDSGRNTVGSPGHAGNVPSVSEEHGQSSVTPWDGEPTRARIEEM